MLTYYTINSGNKPSKKYAHGPAFDSKTDSMQHIAVIPFLLFTKQNNLSYVMNILE